MLIPLWRSMICISCVNYSNIIYEMSITAGYLANKTVSRALCLNAVHCDKFITKIIINQALLSWGLLNKIRNVQNVSVLQLQGALWKPIPHFSNHIEVVKCLKQVHLLCFKYRKTLFHISKVSCRAKDFCSSYFEPHFLISTMHRCVGVDQVK